jgi:disulfide bond formation protein DsbB
MVKIIKDITDDFFPTLAYWQGQRPLWLIGGLSALGLELFSVLFFQTYLELTPCEYCVKIRFAMIVIFFGAMVAAINPKFIAFRLIGYAVTMGGAIWGLAMSAILETITLKSVFSGIFPPCSLTGIVYPLGLKLDAWFPKHFAPEGICGEGPQWFFLGFSMTQWLMVIYMVILTGLFLMLTSWIVSLIIKRQVPLTQEATA